VPLEDIDPDVIAAVEEAYSFCKESDNRLEITFTAAGDAEVFLTAARSYAYQRDAGRLVVIGNVAREGLVARFRVTAYVPPADAEDV